MCTIFGIISLPFLSFCATYFSLRTYHGDAVLKLDTQEPVMGSLQRGKLAGLGSEVVMGGVDLSGSTQGLRGCLKELKIGHYTVSLVSGVEPEEKTG